MSRREARTEVVSLRLTRAERERLDAMGGPTAALRRALEPDLEPRGGAVAPYSSTHIGFWTGASFVWFDGTVGMMWPAPLTA